jgi:hypothetical protein
MTQTLFTLDEANALIPFLTEKLSRAKALKNKIGTRLLEFQGEPIDLEVLFKAENLSEELQALRSDLQLMSDEISDLLDEVQEKGILIKDLDLGLADFFCQFGEETVFLCWKLGETEITQWHGVNEGFSERKNLFEKRYLECVTKLH